MNTVKIPIVIKNDENEFIYTFAKIKESIANTKLNQKIDLLKIFEKFF